MTNVYRVRIYVPTLVGDLNIDGKYYIPIVFASPVIVYS